MTNDTLLTTSFVDNYGPIEFNYITKSCSVSWPLVEIRNIFKLNACFLCCRRKCTQLGDLNSVHHPNPCLKDNVCEVGPQRQCLHEEGKNPCWIPYPKERKMLVRQVWIKGSGVTEEGFCAQLGYMLPSSSFFHLRFVPASCTMKPLKEDRQGNSRSKYAISLRYDIDDIS